MKNIAPFLLLCATAVAQLQSGALQLSPAMPAVPFADVIVFRLDVLHPQGVWLETQNAHGTFAYTMEAQWISQLGDQMPVIGGKGWSFPSLFAVNSWEYGYTTAHLAAGSYVCAMADDTQGLGRDPSSVVPCAVPTTFTDGVVAVTGIGYAIEASTNAVHHRPPFVAHGPLIPCDMVGAFPYAIADGSGADPGVSLTWHAGSQTDTCSGWTGPPFVGFNGACARWCVYNFGAGSGHADAVNLTISREQLSFGGPSTLPDAVLGIALLGLENGAPPLVDVDLDALLPGLFPRHDAMRYATPFLLWPTTVVLPHLQRVQLTAGPDPSIVGMSMAMQAVTFSAQLEGSATDVYSITFW